MPDAIWIDRSEQLAAAGAHLGVAGSDRPRHRIPARTHLLSEIVPAATERGRSGSGASIRLQSAASMRCMPGLDRGRRAQTHSCRAPGSRSTLSDGKHVVSPVFDTQIAAACIGMKPQVGYAELVKTLLDVTIPKGQTRTDWSKRPLSAAQLEYAADDVLYLGDVAAELAAAPRGTRPRALGRARTVWNSRSGGSMNPILQQAWERLRGIGQIAARTARAAPKPLPSGARRWRESAICRAPGFCRMPPFFPMAQANPATAAALDAVQPMNERFAATHCSMRWPYRAMRRCCNRCRIRGRLRSKRRCSNV